MAKITGINGTASFLDTEDLNNEICVNCYLWEVTDNADLRPAGIFGDSGYRSTVLGEKSWDLTLTCMADDAEDVAAIGHLCTFAGTTPNTSVAGNFRIQSIRRSTDRRGDAIVTITALSEGVVNVT